MGQQTMQPEQASQDALVFASDKPKVKELIQDFKACTPWADGNWNRVADNEAVRFTRWSDQHPDGKKHDKADKLAFPFDGASDTRIMLADSIVNENVALCCAAFWRALVRPKAGAAQEGGRYAVALADYFLNTVLYHDLVREVELSEQYRSTLGWVVLHPAWTVELSMRRITLKVEDLVAEANAASGGDQGPAYAPSAQAPNGADASGSPIALLLQTLPDPTQDDKSAELVKAAYLAYAQQQVSKLTVEVKVPELSQKSVRRVVRELREKGQADLAIPCVAKNQPEICALKPWDEIFVPNSCTDIQKVSRVYRRAWMTEVELRSMELTRDWNPKWIAEALKHKGEFTTWTVDATSQGSPPVTLGEAMAGAGTTSWGASGRGQTNSDLVEVIFAAGRQLDEDNVPGIYVTVFHAAVCNDPDNPKQELFAEHGLQGGARCEYPYVTGQRENWSRNITQSRGVPQVAASQQREIKVQRDGLVDHTSMSVTPPLLVPKGAMGSKMKFGPAVQNEVTPGREPRCLDIPQTGAPVAFELTQVVQAEVDNYFGRLSADVPPPRMQVKQTMLTQPFLLMWSKAIQQMLDLAQQFMADEDFAAVTGAPPGWLESHRNALGLMGVELHFDVRELDPEFVEQQLNVINATILPGDVAGVIDRAKFTRLQLQAINPALAKELISDQTAASQAIYRDVQNQIAMMFLGNEPEYVQMDPTAQTKLQFASQIIAGNPNYQSSMQQQGGRFAELMKKWATNLQFSLTQQQNKMVGRIGVVPGGGAAPTAPLGANGNGGPMMPDTNMGRM